MQITALPEGCQAQLYCRGHRVTILRKPLRQLFELVHKHVLVEFKFFLHLPKLSFSVWVISTLSLSFAASLIKHFSLELSPVQIEFSTSFAISQLYICKSGVDYFLIYFFFYSTQPFLTLNFVFLVALQNSVVK